MVLKKARKGRFVLPAWSGSNQDAVLVARFLWAEAAFEQAGGLNICWKATKPKEVSREKSEKSWFVSD